jgi:DNA-binding beta-propeller fold protein YncE
MLNHRVQYFNATGSFLGSWGSEGYGNGQFRGPFGIARGPNGNVYVAESWNDRIQYFTSTGSFRGKWGTPGSGNGQFNRPGHVAVHRNGDVYVADYNNNRVQYFNSTGSFCGKWDVGGYPEGLDVATDGTTFVGCYITQCVEYYTAVGSFLGSFGEFGRGLGSFDRPNGIAVTSDLRRVYVADFINYRIQYFDQTNPAVVPASLGKVKALFR